MSQFKTHILMGHSFGVELSKIVTVKMLDKSIPGSSISVFGVIEP